MGIQTWLVPGLAGFDLILLALGYFLLRTYPPLGRTTLLAMGAGMAGFVFQAFLCFEGEYLILQLATIAGLCGLSYAQHLGLLSAAEVPRPL